jgi:hypothetical protein
MPDSIHLVNSPIFTHVKEQTVDHMAGLHETDKGECCLFAPIAVINKAYKKGIYAKTPGHAFEDENDYEYFRLFRHEYFHLFSLLGTSLGFLHHILWRRIDALSKQIFDHLKKADITIKQKPNFFQSKTFMELSKFNEFDDDAFNLLTAYNIRTLFYHAGYDFELKDYIPDIVNYIHTWPEYKQLSIKKDVDAMVQVLKESERVGPDCLGEVEGNLPPDQYGYDHKTENFFVSTKDILESYARINELIELIAFSYNIFKPFDEKKTFDTYLNEILHSPFNSGIDTVANAKKYSDKFFSNAMKGEYGNALFFFISYIWPDNNPDLLDCLHTAAFITELSLMTSFHSALLSDSSFVYSHFLVPHRFGQLCYIFERSELSFNKLCSIFDNNSIITAMDAICEKIGWVKYSECLNKLLECTDSDIMSTDFHRPAAQKVIKFKLEESVFPACMTMLIPGTVFFSDTWINYPLYDKEKNREKSNLYDIYMRQSYVRSIFNDSFFFHSNYKDFSKLLDRSGLWCDVSLEEKIRQFLKLHKLDSIIDIPV